MSYQYHQARLQFVQFSVNWTIKWSEFGQVPASSPGLSCIGKIFATSCNNVPFLWRAAMFMSSSSPGIGFYLYYRNGPIEKFENMEYTLSIIKSDSSIVKRKTHSSYEAIRCTGRGGKKYFYGKDPVAFRGKYGLKESDPLVVRITLKIPLSVFSYTPIASPPAAPQKWMADLFASIQNPDKLVFSNAKLISRDGDKFYCDKVIGYQSEPLKAIFCCPPPAGKPENEYEFPHLGSTSLKSLLQFLYTGQADLGNLTTTDLIELAEAAEMYHLKPLKQACVIVLWKRVVNNPNSSVAILRFAYIHDDLMDLKHRAMDVLAQNYEALSAGSNDIFGNFHRANLLRNEFLLFLSRRVETNLAG